MAGQGIKINGQEIPWSFVFQVRGRFKGDWDDTMDCFWKARNAQGVDGIRRYINAGWKPGKDGKRYNFMVSKERENGQMTAIRDWWDSLYQRKKPVMTMQQIFAGIAAGNLK